MSCINNPFEGHCTMFDDENPEDDNLGCDKEGNCLVENDECPSDSCTYYESEDDDDYDDGMEG